MNYQKKISSAKTMGELVCAKLGPKGMRDVGEMSHA